VRLFVYEREFLKKARGKETYLPLPILSIGLFLADFVKKQRGTSLAEARFEDLLLRKEEEIQYSAAKTYAVVILVILLGAIMTALLLVVNREEKIVNELTRPGFGSEEQVPLQAWIDGEEEDIIISVSGRDPEGEALLLALDEAFEALKTECLGENSSLEEVSGSLKFPEENDAGIRFSYCSGAPDLISDYGLFLAEEVPEEGISFLIYVTACYGGVEKEYELPVTVVRREEVLTPKEVVERAVREADEAGRKEGALVLPKEVEEMTVSFREKKTSPWLFAGLSLVLAGILYYLPKEKEKEQLKKREEELACSYPQLLSKLNTLIHAGMSIRSAWGRIVKEYREGRKSGERRREYAYEEMSLTLLRLEQGENEGEAYEEFGRRCTLRNYRKLGNLLSQNLRQGISGLEGALEEEMIKALEERKNRALKAGEEAGTKLLFPMILMLGIVVVTLVVPAFLSF